ncbi:MAG TPA: DnaB-like helicase C-terminal domain-containing protein [Sphingopyxis sp.]|uniref:replicative DNA helicase n=1 Tax=Sphingopyxis sp. TaxID=1908224 RepID=UPI002BFFD02E|nr:DnaB-like helicase C-terminal domain-containing protein [Sphingopyxis sp.]HWW56377.1 DnaB-like helicase C-terminal domain-containing protein [Sphingopyxis sp.]
MSGVAEQVGQAENINPLANPEAELRLLGDFIADNRLIDPAADKLRPVDFSVPLYGTAFGVMIQQASAGANVDVVTIAPFLTQFEDWPRLSRSLAAADLNAGTRQQSKAYLEQIVDLSRRRRMVLGLQEVIQGARTPDVGCDELVVQADEAVAEMADQTVSDEQASAGEHAQRVIDSFGKPIVGVRCGINSIDRIVGTLRPSWFVVGGGRPGMGKTAMVSSYAIGAGLRGHATLFFSLEMSADQITRRMLSDLCHSRDFSVPYEQIRDGTVKGRNLEAVIAAKDRLDQLPIEICDRGGLTLAMLGRRVRRQKRRLAAQGKRLELVIVDYLQLMQPSKAGMSPYEAATEISKGLKVLAKDEGLTVFALAQLSRGVESRPDKRPVPSDLRDSGQIEQDADVLLFLYREEYYLNRKKPADEFGPKFEDWRNDMEAVRGKIEFLVPKHRHGADGQSLGFFFGETVCIRGSDFYSAGEGQDYG